MASDQNTGAEIILYAESPSKQRTPLFSGVNEQTGPGGAPDGVQATTKNQELPFMLLSNKVLSGGMKIVPVVKLKVSDGVDASDCVLNVPIMDQFGNARYLSAADFNLSDLPASSPAGVELSLGTGYELSNNEQLRIGGGTYFISVENDTA